MKKLAKNHKKKRKFFNFKYTINYTNQFPNKILSFPDLEDAILAHFPTELEEAEIDEHVVLDYKQGLKKGDQFVTVFTSAALLENAII